MKQKQTTAETETCCERGHDELPTENNALFFSENQIPPKFNIHLIICMNFPPFPKMGPI